MTPRIGVSQCLMGDPVRHDGGHTHSIFVTGLAPWAELIPVCPEIEFGEDLVSGLTHALGPGSLYALDGHERHIVRSAHRHALHLRVQSAAHGRRSPRRRWIVPVVGRVTPRIGVSQCLMGDQVRHDGGHTHSIFVTGLAPWAELIPVCPEIEFGLAHDPLRSPGSTGVPRAPIQLVALTYGDVRLMSVTGETDHTEAATKWAAERVQGLANLRLSGFVLKAGSPSCGLGVTVQGRGSKSQGMFARALVLGMPDLPIIEEAALETPGDQTAFATKVRAYAKRISPQSRLRPGVCNRSKRG